jgi:hypothetical protein
MAIGQQSSLTILVPIALERLKINPLIEGDLCGGDLLKAVLAVNADFWAIHPDFWQQAHQIGREGLARSNQMDDSWKETIQPSMLEAFELFLRWEPATSSALTA